MILIFGSSGFVGTSVSNHFKNKGKMVTEVTRKEYDMTDPNNLSGLKPYNDIEAVIWCSGFNQNDSIGSKNYDTYDKSMNENANSKIGRAHV